MMGEESPPNNFDLDPVTLHYDLWPVDFRQISALHVQPISLQSYTHTSGNAGGKKKLLPIPLWIVQVSHRDAMQDLDYSMWNR